MVHSILFNPASGVWDTTRILARWKTVGYKQGATIDYATLPGTVTRPQTLTDIRNALLNAPDGPIILPQGDLPIEEVLWIKRSHCYLLGHENGTVLKPGKSLYGIYGQGPFCGDPNSLPLKRGWACGGGHIWAGKVSAANPLLPDEANPLTEVGVGRLTIRYADYSTYAGHWLERGRNPIYFWMVHDGFVQDVTVYESDTGVFLGGERLTMRHVAIKEQHRSPDLKGFYGHYGTSFYVKDGLIDRLSIQTKMRHDLNVSNEGSVATHVDGRDLNFDFHHGGGRQLLFDDVDVGIGTRPWAAAVRLDRPNTGPGCVWWNVRKSSGSRLSTLPPDTWFIDNGVAQPKRYTIVGHTQSVNDGVTFVEPIGAALDPPSVYEALKAMP